MRVGPLSSPPFHRADNGVKMEKLLVWIAALLCFLPRSQAAELRPVPVLVSPSIAIVDEHEQGSDRKLAQLLDRYLGVVPDSSGHRASLGAALLILMTLVLQFSAKMADVELRTFGRCMWVAVPLFAGTIVELSRVQVRPWDLVLCGAGNALVWLATTRVALHARVHASLVMLACCALALLSAVLCIEVAGFLLGGHVLS